MCRPDKRFEVKLRLGEIDRRFNELAVVSSRLTHMVEHLTRLRKMNAMVLLHRSQPFKPAQNRRLSFEKLRQNRSMQLWRRC
jgi:hypothetical protein